MNARHAAAADPALSLKENQAFPGEWGEQWRAARRRIEQAGYGGAIAAAYRRHGVELALLASPQAALRLGRAVSELAIRAGRRAAAALPEAALAAAGKPAEQMVLTRWFELVELVARQAPESVPPLLEGTGKLLAILDGAGFEAFVRMGLAAGRGDPERRLRFFRREDDEARHFLDREAGMTDFLALEGRLKSYYTALWGLRPAIREVPREAPDHLRRRVGFGGGVVRVPAAFPGFSAEDSRNLYHAALAHVGAHHRFTKSPFPAGKLKPLQVAVISLIEDARVERLAMAELPGLAALWRPFHGARPGGAAIAVGLMARLARALVDGDYADPDGWVAKGRALFEEAFAADPADQDFSRRIGGLLGNDLGQMRLQFDAKTYVVQPAYRDDNLGIWDFADQEDQAAFEMEQMIETARIETEERDDGEPDRQEPDPDPQDEVNRVSLRAEEENGVLVARYAEFDHATGRERPEWCALREYAPKTASAASIARLLDERADLTQRLTALISASRISRQERVRRQTDGEFLDIDACIEASITRRMGQTPDPRVHGRYERRSRDLCVHLLIDVSRSTGENVSGAARTVLDIERHAAALMAQAMDGLGDPFAIAAFCSDTREDVRYLRVKDFAKPYDSAARARLAGLESGLSTRLGAAIRHAGADLRSQQTYRRLLLLITDGEPSDVDVDDGDYLVEDARAAVHALNRDGIDVFCIALDCDAESYAERIFGRRNVVAFSAIERLPEKLPALYLRLTA
ncbi:nitric oxide reductase activation protein NorD [Nitratireductor soli]|uniref:nitric oxide reductase activation protein NorD n=1 Tax=Nitratireductor soli TaxID=1670619 RepID=UPI00065E2458|nr:VWA domain-containing protein [Nitratireductor soli]